MANVQYIALSVFNPVFCSRTATVKSQSFLIFFFFKKNQTTNQPKPNQSFMSFSIMSVNDLNLEYHCLCSSCYYCFHCGCSYTDSCH